MPNIVYSPSTDVDSIGELALDIQSPADDMLRHKDRVLAGMQQQRQENSAIAQQRLKDLQENFRIEREYAHEAFKFHQEDNKRVAKGILNNKQKEIENIQNRAQTDANKTKAIQQILGTASSFASLQHEKDEARVNKNAKSTAAALSVMPGGATAALENLARIEKALGNKQEIKDNTLRQDMIDAGVPHHEIEEYLGKNARKRVALQKALLQSQASSAGLEMATLAGTETLNINGQKFTFDTFAKRAESYTEWGKAATYLEPAVFSLKEALRAQIGNNQLAMENADKWLSKRLLGIKKIVTEKSKTRTKEENFLTEYKVPYRELKREDGDIQNAQLRSFTAYMSRKPPNVSAQKWAGNFGGFIALGVRSEKVSLTEAQLLRNVPVYSKDKKKTVPWHEQFPDAAREVDAALEERRQIVSQEGLDKATLRRGLEAAEIETYEEGIEQKGIENMSAADFEQDALAAARAGKESLAKHIYKYVGGPGAAPVIMGKLVDEMAATRKLNGTFTLEWINSLKDITDKKKLALRKDWQAQGGDLTGDDKRRADSYKKNVGDMIKGRAGYFNKFGWKSAKAHYTIETAATEAEIDLENRARSKYTTEGDPCQGNWTCAYRSAFTEFNLEFEAGKEGKGKYALSTGYSNKQYTYFSPGTGDTFNSVAKFEEVTGVLYNEGLAGLSNPEFKLIKDKQLLDIMNNEGSNPRIIYEVLNKFGRVYGLKTERDVVNELIKGLNKRSGKDFPLLEATPEVEKIEKISQAMPQQLSWPFDRNQQGIAESYEALRGNYHPNNLKNNLQYVNPLVREVFIS